MPATLENAIAAIKSGDKETGKEILHQLLRDDPENDKAWVWMTAVVNSDEMRLECLETALGINPDNKTAQKGMQQLRGKLGLPEEDEVAEEEELAFPELTYYGAAPERAKSYTTETWTYDKYKPEPPPPPTPSKTRQVSSKIGNAGKRSFLSTPFFTILFAPRITVETILEVAPKRHLLLLSVVIGIFNMITSAQSFSLQNYVPAASILLAAFCIGPIYAIVYFYVAGFIFSMSGFALGGEGTTGEVRAALLWANVPRLYLFPIQLIIGYLLVDDLAKLSYVFAGVPLSQLLSTQALIFICITLAASIWIFYIHLECIGAAHKFSAWRAWATLLLPTIILFVVFFGLFFLIWLSYKF